MAESLTLALKSDTAMLTQSWRQKNLLAKIPSQIALVDKKYVYKNYMYLPGVPARITESFPSGPCSVDSLGFFLLQSE